MASNCESPEHTGDAKEGSDTADFSSHDILLDVPRYSESERPPIVQYFSMPTYQSPLRHHRRTPSHHREVKETLNARSEYKNSQDDGKSQHYINQYLIGEEIGRGSFGAVHLATDQYGHEFAVKEFSKARLRKRAQSNILRRPHGLRRPGHLAAGLGFNAPLHRHSASDIHNGEENGNPLYLIKEEIAIMKKLNHHNLVQLIEVLDDPDEDSLYMVLEMCKKGVIMKVGLDEKADPYDEESCRYWFRDLILGIEYLHAQGVVHRDIKPDNLLLTEDDVLKIVDFGVSEMFEKESNMMTAKTAGSPAFLPPELCVARHGEVSGKAADIWSMGVSLYCLRFGRIPFERLGALELYEAIKNEDVDYGLDNGPQFLDLMKRILEKDPMKRITMKKLREHPWVTKGGKDPLLPEEENTADLIGPPTEIEMNRAITFNMRKLLVVRVRVLEYSSKVYGVEAIPPLPKPIIVFAEMKAVNKFKRLLYKKRPELIPNVLGENVPMVQPPLRLDSPDSSEIRRLHKSQSVDLSDRRPVEGALVSEGVHRKIESPPSSNAPPLGGRMGLGVAVVPSIPDSRGRQAPHHRGHHSIDIATPTPQVADTRRTQSSGEKGHAHDPTDEAPLWLGIGVGGADGDRTPDSEVIAESPCAAEFNIYDTAYENEVERIRKAQGHRATIYLTRQIDSKKEYIEDESMVEATNASEKARKSYKSWKDILDAAREKEGSINRLIYQSNEQVHDHTLTGLGQAGETVKTIEAPATIKEHELRSKGGTTIANIVSKAIDKNSGKVQEG